jgi:hypothetical protein
MIEPRSDSGDLSGEAMDSEARPDPRSSGAASETSAEGTSVGSSPAVGGRAGARGDTLDREVPLDVVIARDELVARDASVELPDDVVYERADLALDTPPREERVRRRAYEIYLERTRAAEAGDAVSDWLAAEREVLE